MPNIREKLIDERLDLIDVICYAMRDWDDYMDECRETETPPIDSFEDFIADGILSAGYRKQKWTPVSEPPKENGYYLCVILFSAVNNKKEYRRKILFWEDNVWIEMANCFRTVRPLYWMPMAEMPQPPKGD